MTNAELIIGEQNLVDCRLYVIDFASQSITLYPAAKNARWRGGRKSRSPQTQARVDRVWELRQTGLSYAKIGAIIGVSATQIRDTYARACRERAAEIPPDTSHD